MPSWLGSFATSVAADLDKTGESYRIIDGMPQNRSQTTLRIPSALRDRLLAQARSHGRTLAAEIRAACELAPLWMLQHDRATRVRLRADLEARELLAREAAEHLCRRLFGTHSPIEALLTATDLLDAERPAGEPGVHEFTAGRGRGDSP
jgi:hypothetical protein